MLIIFLGLNTLNQFITISGFITFFLYGCALMLMINVVYICVYKNKNEFKYFWEILKNIVLKIKNKVKV